MRANMVPGAMKVDESLRLSAIFWAVASSAKQ
jgi:hypothetical protein